MKDDKLEGAHEAISLAKKVREFVLTQLGGKI